MNRGSSVLIVEDDAALRHAIADFFATSGFQVRSAEHGAEALRVLDRQPPDILVLDLVLPWVNGLEVLATVRQRPTLRLLPVVITTGTATSDFDVRAYRPVKVVRKPFDFEALLAAAEALLLEVKFADLGPE